MMLDHLLLVTPDLPATVAWVERLTGIAPAPGGSHPGAGTRNYLLGLGEAAYLEIIGCDIARVEHQDPLPFGLGTLAAPRLVTWALRVDDEDIERRVAVARAHGFDPGSVQTRTRVTSEGTVVSARVTPPADGPVPFLIDWCGSPHPAAALSAIAMPELVALHPEPDAVRPALRALGADLEVRPGIRFVLVATLRCGKDTIALM